MIWESSAVTDRGQARAKNEDAYAIREDRGIFVLADGMGGHAAGEVASTLAAERGREAIADAPGTGPPDDRIEAAMREPGPGAPHATLDRAGAEPDKPRTGT